MRFKLVRIQLWFEILKYLEGTDYFEWMMTEMNLLANGYAETISCFPAGCESFLDLQQTCK